MFGNAYLGETLVAEPGEMLGKTIVTNLMDLTKSIKQQNINIRFKVNGVKENDAFTEVVEYEMNPSSIRRLVRRNIAKLDDSFIVSTSDGKYVRVKPLVITRSAAILHKDI
jgi:ribosomal protein S3AE